MNLYVAIRGPSRGKIFDLTDEGLEEMNFHEKTKGLLTPAGYQGLIIPFSTLQKDLIQLAKRGEQVDTKIYEHVNKG